MAAAPWFLLAAGVGVLITGAILAAVRGASANQTYIDPRMDDDEIGKILEQAQGDLLSKLVMSAGGLMILISIVWRIVRMFL